MNKILNFNVEIVVNFFFENNAYFSYLRWFSYPININAFSYVISFKLHLFYSPKWVSEKVFVKIEFLA